MNLKDEISLDDNPFFKDFKGIAGTGTYYHTNKPSEIAFIVKFLEKYLEKQPPSTNNNDGEIDYVKILLSLKKDDDEKYGQITITTAKDKNGKLLVLNKGDEDIQSSGNEKESTTKSAAIFHAMLHFFKADRYEAIVSMEHKQAIVKALYKECSENKFEPEIDWKLYCIKQNLSKEITSNEVFTFYDEEVIEKWNPTILPAKKCHWL